MMGLIRRSYTCLERISFRCLFNSLVRPHLEHYVSVWYQLIKNDKELLEKCFASTKLISGLYDKPYNERLAAIKVPSMRYCRMRGDMILVYKILRGDSLYAICLQSTNPGQDAITLNFINYSFKLQYVNIFLV